MATLTIGATLPQGRQPLLLPPYYNRQQRKRGSARAPVSTQRRVLAARGKNPMAHTVSGQISLGPIEDMISRGTVATIGTWGATGENVELLVAIGNNGPLACIAGDDSSFAIHMDIAGRSVHVVPLSCPLPLGRNKVLALIQDDIFLIYRSAVAAINRTLQKSMSKKGQELLAILQTEEDRGPMNHFNNSVYAALAMYQIKLLRKKACSSAQTIMLGPGVAFMVDNFTVAPRLGSMGPLRSDDILSLQSVVTETVERDPPEDAMQAYLRMYSTVPLSQMTIRTMVALGGLDREPDALQLQVQ